MYQITDSGILRISDEASIPVDPANTDYAEYLAWLAAGNVPLPLDAPVLDAQVIADRRYVAEVAGITLSGLHINTDDRSKLLINGAALEATIDPEYVMQWKTPGGFVELTGAQVIGVARAIRAHVQACFDREAELLAELEAGRLTDDMLEHGWPAP